MTPQMADGLVQPTDTPRHHDMTWIPGGTFRMGSEDFYPEERPVHEVGVDGFWMDYHEVTNEQFTRFVEATRYKTLAERPLNPADSSWRPSQKILCPAPWSFTRPVARSTYATTPTGGPGCRGRVGAIR